MPYQHTLPKKRRTLCTDIVQVALLLFLGTWLILPATASAESNLPGRPIIQTDVDHYGWASVTLSTQWHGQGGLDHQPLPGSIVHIRIIETYPDILSKECREEAELPDTCRTDNPKVIYQGYLQTNSNGDYRLNLHLRGYYHLDAKLVKVKPEFESLINNVPDEYRQTLLGFDSTSDCSLTPEVKPLQHIYPLGEPILFHLTPKPSGCGNETPNRYYRVQYGNQSEVFRVDALGTLIEFNPGNTDPGLLTVHILDEPQENLKIGGLSLTTEFISFPPIYPTLEKLETSKEAPQSSIVYSKRPIFRDNAFNVYYYDKVLAKDVKINPNGLNQTTVTVFPIDEIAHFPMGDIKATLCTQSCQELDRAHHQPNDGAPTFDVPRNFYGTDAELFVYTNKLKDTDLGIKVTIPPGIINLNNILIAVGFLLLAFAAAAMVRRLKILHLLPATPGPKDDPQEHIVACVKTVYHHLLGKEMEACSDPAKLLYMDAEMQQLSNLKEIEQYCLIIRNALANNITNETIRTVRNRSMRLLKRSPKQG
ncbi:MAG: hypothetical protein J6A01_06270 [Proteobacteria bacterium]|nr:hypothetical protein [Pseudomonadota bacterium]